ncbi:MAG: hypothetical protein ACI4JR_09410 [Acutalibacteraceae bacterium]
MIVTETRSDGLIRTYSDSGKKIQKVGTDKIYDEAIDLASAGYTYVETDESDEISDAEALSIITGGEET